MHEPQKQPVGVFDSGVGGLSVLRAIRDELPLEDLLYIGDSGHAPYGDRPASFVVERALALTRFLVDRGAKAVVVACNTATGIAVQSLRSHFAVPIVAIEPAVKPAAARTRSRVVGVLATSGTLASPNVGKLLASYGADVKFLIQPCPGLADRIEAGDIPSPATRALVDRYVRPLVEEGADILVLGCTHYPFVRSIVEEIAGAGVEIIDPAVPVARELRRRLEAAGLLASSRSSPGTEQFWTTGDASSVAPVMSGLWGSRVVIAGEWSDEKTIASQTGKERQ